MTSLVGNSLGRYELQERIGRGGMAEVYRATDVLLERQVAVKVIRPSFAEDLQFVERFLREARLVAGLDHPHILPVFDFGEEQGRAFLVMPLVSGGTLSERLKEGPLAVEQAVEWVEQLAEALDAAHAAGVLHRDIKPGNVLIHHGDRLALGDFGIARLAEVTSQLTATGTVVGTPLYMAPELASGGTASPATDRYALAIMIYEMVVGQPPFRGENPLSVLHQHVNDPAPRVRDLLPSAPETLDTFFAAALAKEPVHRPESAAGLAAALRVALGRTDTILPAVGGSGSPSTPTELASAPTLALEPESSSPGPTAASRPPGRRRRPGRLLVLVPVLALVLLVWLWLRGGQQPVPGSGPVERTEVGANDTGPPLEPAGDPTGVESSQGSAPPVPGESSAAESVPEGRDLAPRGPAGARGPDGRPGAAADERFRATLEVAPELGRLIAGHTRMSGEHFSRLRRWASTEAGADVAPGLVEVVAIYAAGGEAYLAGEVEVAQARLHELARSNEILAPWGAVWPARAFSQLPSELYLALAYGDARHEGQRLLQAQGRGRRADRSLGLARAYLEHLGGSHQRVLTMQRLLAPPGRRPEAREDPGTALAVQFLALEAIELQEVESFWRFYRRALEAGRSLSPPQIVPFVLQSAVASESLPGVEAVAVAREACRSGVPAVCGLLGRAAELSGSEERP